MHMIYRFFFFNLIDKPAMIDTHDTLVLTVSVMPLFRVFCESAQIVPFFLK